jgi:hypothetical protein
MALVGGHRFGVSMGEVFPHGVFALTVEEAMDFDEKSGRRSPSKDKVTGLRVYAVTCIDRDPEARRKEVKVKVLADVQPVLPVEVLPGSGLCSVVFSGMTVTPYVEDGRGGGRSRLAVSLRATGVHEPGKATGSSTGASSPGTGSGTTSGSGGGSAGRATRDTASAAVGSVVAGSGEAKAA